MKLLNDWVVALVYVACFYAFIILGQYAMQGPLN